MSAAFITFSDLQTLSGLRRKADVIRWADKNGVKYKYSRDGIWTTPDALNAAVGVHSAMNEGHYAVEAVI